MDINKFIEELGENKAEFFLKGAQCKSAEELLVLAKEKGIALDEAGAAELFESLKIKTAALTDEELDKVAGGVTTARYTGTIIMHCYKLSESEQLQKYFADSSGSRPNNCPDWKYAENGPYVKNCTTCKNFGIRTF